MTVADQTWDPDRYRTNAGFVAELGMPVVDLLGPQPGERILDLGCGDGALTRKLAAMGCEVTGVDASPDQIRKAREEGLDAHVMDGQKLSFDGEFDAVFTNAALHWMKDPAAVVAGVRKALKPGGRFVGEFGGAGNVRTIRTAVRVAVASRGVDPDSVDPWYFPTPEAYSAILQDGGFAVKSAELIDRPTPLPGDIEGWLAVFCESFLNQVPEADRSAAIAQIRTALRPILTDPDGTWVADYVRLRFSAEFRS